MARAAWMLGDQAVQASSRGHRGGDVDLAGVLIDRRAGSMTLPSPAARGGSRRLPRLRSASPLPACVCVWRWRCLPPHSRSRALVAGRVKSGLARRRGARARLDRVRARRPRVARARASAAEREGLVSPSSLAASFLHRGRPERACARAPARRNTVASVEQRAPAARPRGARPPRSPCARGASGVALRRAQPPAARRGTQAARVRGPRRLLDLGRPVLVGRPPLRERQVLQRLRQRRAPP